MEGIKQWIEAEGSGHWFFIAFPVILLVLFIWFKGRRVRFLIPSLLISIVIINPLFYKYWDELGLYAYWRILWVVPVIPVMAGLVPSLTERIRKTWVKSIVAVAGVGAIVLGGTFIYNGAGGSFVEAADAAKLPDYVVKIADKLLELDEHPRVVAENPIGVYLRQNTGEIGTLFGRDVFGYIVWPSMDASNAYRQLSNPEGGDLHIVARVMRNNDYDYLIVNEANSNIQAKLEPEGFDHIDSIGEFGIYKVNGYKPFRREWNDYGQVVSLTTIDKDGNPYDMNNGYCTIQYGYDYYGNVSDIKYVDYRGDPVLTSMGFASVHREYTDYEKMTSEQYLGDDENPIMQLAGYEQIAQEYKDDSLASRSYLDRNGDFTNRSDGYSKVVWRDKEKNGLRDIIFYDMNGQEVSEEGINLIKDYHCSTNGWSGWMTPEKDESNCCFTICTAEFAVRQGDVYSIQIDIEFSDVTATPGKHSRIYTQGMTDGKWGFDNIWNHVFDITDVPENGVYQFAVTYEIDEHMTNANTFDIGFRCDNWSSGSFRVGNVKIEKGNSPSEWTPGL